MNCTELPASSRGCVRFGVITAVSFHFPPYTQDLKSPGGIAVNPSNEKVPMGQFAVMTYFRTHHRTLQYKGDYEAFLWQFQS